MASSSILDKGVSPRLRRSALYLPASNQRAITKARSLDCDVLIFDLEDAVTPDFKAIARSQAVTAAREGGFGRAELVVRVNHLDTDWGADDIRAVGEAPFDAVLLPKVSDGDDVDCVIQGWTATSTVRVWAMIETARSLTNLQAIAARVSCLVAGTNDLSLEIGAQLNFERRYFIGYLGQMVAAARAAGIGVLDGVFNAIDDKEGLKTELEQARAMGFDGKTLIHPSQIVGCNAAFVPDEGEAKWANSVIHLFAQPENAGLGAVRFEGKMVERLHLKQAQRTLAIWNAQHG